MLLKIKIVPRNKMSTNELWSNILYKFRATIHGFYYSNNLLSAITPESARQGNMPNWLDYTNRF